MLKQNPKRKGIIETLRYLYESDARAAQSFRYGLLAFDILTVLFIVFTSFIPDSSTLEWLDVGFGVLILLDFLARLAISRNRLRELAHPASWADMAAIVSFLAPIAGEAAGFLRILRTVRLLHTYQLLARLRQDSVWFRRHEDIVLASVNLAVFLFVMSGIVYASQHGRNPGIGNYVDALYYTVTALTTTGFGDITLQGTFGRFLSIVIMILGVTLFLMLVRVLVQPAKVRFRCPQCALLRHDADAVHCKDCGTVLNIPNDD
jgi:voltage-gated potassium channel